ncbi:MAG: glycine dehydrogenase, partial [candidate division WOR-3 bacterium]|nr:glycine dehydrogenase [candidate division WOR-3 bacterium]
MFVPNTAQDRQEMLPTVGVKSVDELFSVIPEKLRFKGNLNLPAPLSELEIKKLASAIAEQNANQKDYVSFL